MIGTFGTGGNCPNDWLVFLGRAGGGGCGDTIMGWTLMLQSFELRLGEIRDGKLNVFVHCDKLRTIFKNKNLIKLIYNSNQTHKNFQTNF